MSHLNQTLFLLLNAPTHPSQLLIEIALFFAKYFIVLVPIILIIGWLRGDEGTKKLVVMAGMSAIIGLIVNSLFGLVWFHPRPFAIHLGTNFLPHSNDSSFPSDHLTFFWSVAVSFALSRQTRLLGGALIVLGLPVAWARIYLGVHYPFDMIGSFVVAIAAATICKDKQHYVVEPVFKLLSQIYDKVIATSCPQAKIKR
ncbi:undecaprenyl-diphosphatase [Vibrio marisflavi]|uniref:undecaprenyl-diphosphate phosphatase n=1 Tax=Vibrio marisflavi CECT 7928 TaxID=634439 RepID=A0ABN8E8W6_9VIBR|nr:undecaprenyl-diphosphatase [Vibrio marisflavi]CAH0542916.1 Undecaprenyl-diphosphatase BcrC [Vibrio marisflavi CECT 7928]